jgi:Protein of unknown function (DUF3501)
VKPIRFEETLSLTDYERVRPRLRPLFIHEKNRRRLAVGSHLTFLFENAQTVWYQVHEMIRTEQMRTADAIAHELETYNELLPGADALSATLLIEYESAPERDAALRRLVGLERHLHLVLGDRRSSVEFDRRQMDTERLSAVQFVRLPMAGVTRVQFLQLAAQDRLAIEADHPSLAARASIDAALAAALAEDLG